MSPDPLSSFHRHRPGLPHYPGLQGPHFPLISRCNSSTLLSNLGLRYCSGRQGPLGPGPAPGPCGYAGSYRPYRSMENLNWNAVADPGPCAFGAAPYRSTDSEFILRYTSTSHWYDGPPDGSMMGAPGLVPNQESLVFYPRHVLPRKDLPLFPQLLFLGGVDEWDARKGLREKLRLQSARSSAEHLKHLPLRPLATPLATPLAAASRPPSSTRITSPEEIKQEVLRRLQLRRQNSSPNLALHCSPSSPEVVKTSYTTDNIAGTRRRSESASERRRPPVGRLHIPTFEEFKRMRQKEGDQESTAGSVRAGRSEGAGASGVKSPPGGGNRKKDSEEVQGEPRSTTYTPICTGPRRRSSLEPAGSVPFPPSRENWGRPSSCCPALLPEGTDLSSYGAKISKMKDGLIGSALDLIKKR